MRLYQGKKDRILRVSIASSISLLIAALLLQLPIFASDNPKSLSVQAACLLLGVAVLVLRELIEIGLDYFLVRTRSLPRIRNSTELLLSRMRDNQRIEWQSDLKLLNELMEISEDLAAFNEIAGLANFLDHHRTDENIRSYSGIAAKRKIAYEEALSLTLKEMG